MRYEEDPPLLPIYFLAGSYRPAASGAIACGEASSLSRDLAIKASAQRESIAWLQLYLNYPQQFFLLLDRTNEPLTASAPTRGEK